MSNALKMPKRIAQRAGAVLRRQIDRTTRMLDVIRQRLSDGQPISPADDARQLRVEFDGTIDALGEIDMIAPLRGLAIAAELDVCQLTPEQRSDPVRMRCAYCDATAEFEVIDGEGCPHLVCEADINHVAEHVIGVHRI